MIQKQIIQLSLAKEAPGMERLRLLSGIPPDWRIKILRAKDKAQ